MRTLDSVIRARKVFGLKEVTIISQEFHNKRAIYLAGNNGLDAIGFNAKDVNRSYGFRTSMREYIARSVAILDVLFQTGPKHLGEPVRIGIDFSQHRQDAWSWFVALSQKKGRWKYIEVKTRKLATELVMRTSSSMKLEDQENEEERIMRAIINRELPKALWA